MELHPILELDTKPNDNLWYVVSALGDSPSMRVGHTCTFVKNISGGQGRVYVIGGANPSGSFGEVYILDLETLTWDTLDTPGFKARYEHVAFIPKSYPDKIYIFGGADQTGNLNDVQILDLVSNDWSTMTVQGTPPSPRTHHTTAVVGNKLVVYSGGHSGAEPVGDRKVHILDVTTCTWSAPSFNGEPPKPRHGHLMLAVGKKVYVHGGMASSTFYDDLHVLDFEKGAWSSIKKKKTSPSARAAHGGVVSGTDIYTFGGMNKDGALDELYKLDTITNTWCQLKLDGPPPASRLDFGICVIEIERDLADVENTAITSEGENTKESVEKVQPPNGTENGPQPEMKTYKLCFINGGMDTQGEIFDDSLGFCLPIS
ncbi:hypothetical protein LOTGIDRAFT_121915 [Lottia gigantea]|uniref:Rab9 effector protein with kelch motifs n=1 Tax=Lottia gigantea TaxID=225164 RepID=V3ZK45_LOTGI|nr:hypothetical protein LOTGIDRAFT_121915 [Lottia gigantea]ESO91673.1 hypothetical protein LOTGIDRAFT_121915 [Lottia gigantea]